MSFCIYKIVNTINDKVYVGSTYPCNEEIRWGLHRRDARKYLHRPLYAAMNEFGIDNFSMQVIEIGEDEDTCFKREQHWIDYLDSMYPHGYNVARAH